MTAFYMFRLIRMTFYGTFRGTPGAAPARPRVARDDDGPALDPRRAAPSSSAGSAIPKFILGKENSFERFLEPVITPLAADWHAAAARDRRTRRSGA